MLFRLNVYYVSKKIFCKHRFVMYANILIYIVFFMYIMHNKKDFIYVNKKLPTYAFSKELGMNYNIPNWKYIRTYLKSIFLQLPTSLVPWTEMQIHAMISFNMLVDHGIASMSFQKTGLPYQPSKLWQINCRSFWKVCKFCCCLYQGVPWFIS